MSNTLLLTRAVSIFVANFFFPSFPIRFLFDQSRRDCHLKLTIKIVFQFFLYTLYICIYIYMLVSYAYKTYWTSYYWRSMQRATSEIFIMSKRKKNLFERNLLFFFVLFVYLKKLAHNCFQFLLFLYVSYSITWLLVLW